MPRVWAKVAHDDDWQVEPRPNGRGHVRLRYKDGHWVTAPMTGSDWRGQLNVLSSMRHLERGQVLRGHR